MFGFENMLHSEFTDMPFKIMFLSIVFLFGICIGSFLNVVILRLPRHESLIKRSVGVKDSSSRFPGMGGILDIFDSILFSAPFMYIYVITFIK